jgi:hypothetical protein
MRPSLRLEDEQNCGVISGSCFLPPPKLRQTKSLLDQELSPDDRQSTKDLNGIRGVDLLLPPETIVGGNLNWFAFSRELASGPKVTCHLTDKRVEGEAKLRQLNKRFFQSSARS